MNVIEFLHDLGNRGFKVDSALNAVKYFSSIRNAPVVINRRLKTCAGLAYRRKDGSEMKIELSSKLWLAKGDEAWHQVYETFLHELAHLLTVDVSSHDDDWVASCYDIGLMTPEQYHNHPHFQRVHREKKIVGVCSKCSHEFIGRKSLNRKWTYSCPYCGGDIRKMNW